MTDILTKHKRGRPPRGEQANIEKKLRPYYEKCISATVTAARTDFNIKTVSKYFDKWTKQIVYSDMPEFIQRCKEEKERCLVSYDGQICSLDDDKNELEQLIQNSKYSGNLSQVGTFYKLKLKVTEMICALIAAKNNLVSTPTADTVVDIEGKERDSKDDNSNTK